MKELSVSNVQGILHCVSNSSSGLRSCLVHADDGDAVLLMQDAVVGAIQGSDDEYAVAAARPGVVFFVLQPHLEVLGLGGRPLIACCTPLDYTGMVTLAVRCRQSMNWG